MEDLSGRQFGPYVILQPLGEGGMATVYKAYQPSVERYVAVKVLPQQYANDREFSVRFKREAKTLASLQHAHILPIFDFGQDNNYSYMVMPLIEGGTLASLKASRTLSFAEVIKIVSQIAAALSYAHSHGLVHRDVKPSNVLMDEAGNCLLSDFGIARIIEGSMTLTGAGIILGTPAYMSPEQSQSETVDARSDIYSLGIILYEMLTGRVPFRAETPVAVLIKHVMDPLPLPRTLNPEIPTSLERIILKALAKDPASRYQTAAEFEHALQSVTLKAEPKKAAAAPKPTPPVPVPIVTPPLPPVGAKPGNRPSRSLIPIGLIAVAVIAVATLLAATFLRPGQVENPAAAVAAAPTGAASPTQIAAATSPAPTQEPATAPPTPIRTPTLAQPSATPRPATATLAAPAQAGASPTVEPTPTKPPATSGPAPTATPTPVPAAKLAAPQMQSPQQNAFIPFGETPRFQWSSAGALAANQYYRVSVEHSQGFDVRCTRNTTILARDYVASLAPSGRPFRWSVSVIQSSQPVAEGAACDGSQVVASGFVGEFTVGTGGGGGGGGGGGSSGAQPTFTPRP